MLSHKIEGPVLLQSNPNSYKSMYLSRPIRPSPKRILLARRSYSTSCCPVNFFYFLLFASVYSSLSHLLVISKITKKDFCFCPNRFLHLCLRTLRKIYIDTKSLKKISVQHSWKPYLTSILLFSKLLINFSFYFNSSFSLIPFFSFFFHLPINFSAVYDFSLCVWFITIKPLFWLQLLIVEILQFRAIVFFFH